MSVKNVVLKTGEQLICDIKEGFVGEQLVCYQLSSPCSVVINEDLNYEPSEDGETNKLKVALFPWPQLSSETDVKIAIDMVVTIVEPTQDLKSLYTEKVLNGNTNAEPAEPAEPGEDAEFDQDNSSDE